MPLPEGEIGVGGKLTSTYIDDEGNIGKLLDLNELEGIGDNAGLAWVFSPNADGTLPTVSDAMVLAGAVLLTRNGLKRASQRRVDYDTAHVTYATLSNRTASQGPIDVNIAGGTDTFAYWGAFSGPSRMPGPTAVNQRAYDYVNDAWYIGQAVGTNFFWSFANDDGVPIGFRGNRANKTVADHYVTAVNQLVFFAGAMHQVATIMTSDLVNEWHDPDGTVETAPTLSYDALHRLGVSPAYQTEISELGASQAHTQGWILDRVYTSEDFFGAGNARPIRGMTAFGGNPIAIDAHGNIGVFGGDAITPSGLADVLDDTGGILGLAKRTDVGYILTGSNLHQFNIGSDGAWTSNPSLRMASNSWVDMVIPEHDETRFYGLQVIYPNFNTIGVEALEIQANGSLTVIAALGFSMTVAQVQAAFPDFPFTQANQAQAISANDNELQIYCEAADHAFTLAFTVASDAITPNPENSHMVGYVDAITGATLRGSNEFISTQYVVRRYDRVPAANAIAGRLVGTDAAIPSTFYRSGQIVNLNRAIYICLFSGNYTLMDIANGSSWRKLSGGVRDVREYGLPQPSMSTLGEMFYDGNGVWLGIIDDIDETLPQGTFTDVPIANPYIGGDFESIAALVTEHRPQTTPVGRIALVWGYNAGLYTVVEEGSNRRWSHLTSGSSAQFALDMLAGNSMGESFWLGLDHTDARALRGLAAVDPDRKYYYGHISGATSGLRVLNNSTFVAGTLSHNEYRLVEVFTGLDPRSLPGTVLLDEMPTDGSEVLTGNRRKIMRIAQGEALADIGFIKNVPSDVGRFSVAQNPDNARHRGYESGSHGLLRPTLNITRLEEVDLGNNNRFEIVVDGSDPIDWSTHTALSVYLRPWDSDGDWRAYSVERAIGEDGIYRGPNFQQSGYRLGFRDYEIMVRLEGAGTAHSTDVEDPPADMRNQFYPNGLLPVVVIDSEDLEHLQLHIQTVVDRVHEGSSPEFVFHATQASYDAAPTNDDKVHALAIP